ncbi:hypothetical protein B4U79_01351 [Dinothrombium tinctorium]|uniref:Insulin-degrading enzyme-like protein n=1 Tax=Dinothrombium tinctorium TaxID=1965070 RepID=A0A3S3Q8F4_9ACAR|nr:hypothetical protein B4U79_01351 [Dinothrombium tinctorium]
MSASLSREKTNFGEHLASERVTSSKNSFKFSAVSKLQANNEGISKIFTETLKQPNDERSFEAFNLTNGLKLLLISDPTAEKAAVSMIINVGSFSDPKSFQGLAHLLKNLIFFNHIHRADSDEFIQFVEKNGGSSYAQTYATQTAFNFDVSTKYLNGSLERFVSLFVSPDFSDKVIEKEIQTLNSAHLNYMNNDNYRVLRVLKENADQAHPYSKFEFGNLKSLKNFSKSSVTNLRHELIKFYNKYYSSNLMSVSVLSSERIEKLQEMARPLFEKIENTNVTVPKWDEIQLKTQQTKKKITIVPIEDHHKLDLHFPTSILPSYVIYLLNQKGNGSLSRYLKNENLCLAINSKASKNFEIVTTNVEFDLTEKGIERLNDVIVAFFQYINMIKGVRIKRWIYEEIQNLNKINSQFKDKNDELDEAIETSFKMQVRSNNETKEQSAKEFQPRTIRKYLNLISPENMIAIIQSSKFANKTNEREKWCGVEYSIEHFEEEFLSNLKRAKSYEFHFPDPNEFVAKNFALKKREKNGEQLRLIDSSENSRSWFLQNLKFNAKSLFAIYFKSPFIRIDPLYTVCAEIFVNLIDYELDEELSKGKEAGLSFKAEVFKYGIKFCFHGFRDKLNAFILTMINEISELEFKEQSFVNVKREYFRELKSWKSKEAFTIAAVYANGILEQSKWLDEEKMTVEQQLTFDTFKHVMLNIFSKVFIESFAYGNYESNEATELVNEITEIMKHRFLLLPSHNYALKNGILHFQHSSSFVFETNSSFENTNAIFAYFQFGKKNISESVKLRLLEKIMSQRFFYYLRIKENLSYVVYTNLASDEGYNYGIEFVIQSSSPASYLDHRIDAFLLSFRSELENMSSDDFEMHRNGLLKSIERKPKNFFSSAKRILKELEEGTYLFTRQKMIADELKKVNKKDLLQIFDVYLLCESKQRSKLSVRVGHPRNETESSIGQRFCSKSKLIKLEEIKDYKASLPFYPSKQRYSPKQQLND